VGSDRGGCLVPIDDVDGMAEHICSLLLDHDRRSALGTSARRWVEAEFSLDALARNTADVYECVLKRRGMNSVTHASSNGGAVHQSR
jgi:glycosyltransferase involved in cell wall biosynthesis